MRYVWIVLLWPCIALGQNAIEIGKETQVKAPLCVTLEDARKIADADRDKGIKDALKVLQESPNCDLLHVRVKPLRVVYRVKGSDDRDVKVIQVAVQMADGSWFICYVLADVEVKGLADS